MIKKEILGKSAFVLFVLLCCFHIKFGVIAGWNKIVSDFPNYYVSSKLISTNRNALILYNDSIFNKEVNAAGIKAQGQFSLYPPPTAFIMLPLTIFNPVIAKRLWLVINLLLLVSCVCMITQIVSISWLWASNSLLLFGFCLTNDLMLGQVYLFMLTLTLGGYLLLENRKGPAGAFLWGMVMSLKYYTFVFIPVFFIKKEYKMVVGLLASFFIINLIGLYFLGLPVYTYFVDEIFLKHLQGRIIGQTAFSIQFQSIESLLNNLFIKDVQWNPNPYFESSILFKCLKIVFYLAPVYFSMLIIRRYRKHFYFIEVSSSVLLTLLLLLEPGSATYHMILLGFPLILAIKVWINTPQQNFIYYLVSIIFGIGFLSVLFNYLAAYFNLPLLFQYNRLWMLTLFFIALLCGFWQGNKVVKT